MDSKQLQELRLRHHACSNANEVIALALEAERLRAALASVRTVMRVLLAPGEHTSGCGCPEAVCVLRRETWSQIESALAGTEAKSE